MTRKYMWKISPEQKAELTKRRVETMQAGKRRKREAAEGLALHRPTQGDAGGG